MTDQIRLVDLAGYQFFQVTFAVALCCVAYIFLKYWICLLVFFVCYKCLIALIRKWTNEQVDVRGRGVFITGCDTGLGFAFARHLDEVGFTVFAGCLHEKGPGAKRLKSVCSKRLHVLDINVTTDTSVAKAYTYVRNNIPKQGLWAVINNAGLNMVGDVELTHVAAYTRILEVNLYGGIRVVRAFLPLIRESRGRVVNIGSVHGRFALPNKTVYEVSKHGMETLSDSLRLEMQKFGVAVTIVQPGKFGTVTSIENEATIERYRHEIEEMWSSASSETLESYSKQQCLLNALPSAAIGSWPPTANIDRMLHPVEHALCSTVPKTRYMVPGIGTKLSFADEYAVLTVLHPLLPTWLMDWVICAWTGCDKQRTR